MLKLPSLVTALGGCLVVQLLAVGVGLAQTDGEAIPGIGPTGPVKKVEGGFQFTEGPATDADGYLYFTDIPANRIYRMNLQGKISVWVEPSNHCNGLMFNFETKEIFACEMDGQLVAYALPDKKRRVLAGKYEGDRFNAPNDLVIDKQGGVYFTDPTFRAPDPLPQDKMGVYYRDQDGEVTRIIDDLPLPNGVILSPDEKTLYVVPTGQDEMMAYPVKSPGKIGAGKVFARLKQPEGASNTGGDGLTIDTDGNLYITSRLGVQVFTPAGKHLGTIQLPEQPANVTFGGPDNRVLYATARTSLYAIPMKAQGHQFAR